MKILRRELRRRIYGDLDYAIGLLQDIYKVAFKGYGTSGFRLDIDIAIGCLTSAKMSLRNTKFKKEKK